MIKSFVKSAFKSIGIVGNELIDEGIRIAKVIVAKRVKQLLLCLIAAIVVWIVAVAAFTGALRIILILGGFVLIGIGVRNILKIKMEIIET